MRKYIALYKQNEVTTMAHPIYYVLVKADSAEDASCDAEYALEPYRGAVFNHLRYVKENHQAHSTINIANT